MSARLAVCIPVHHGRALPLAELFERLVPQLPEDGSVQICVSDNASRDGTRELVEGLRESLGPERVRYHRHDTDRGLTENMLSVVEMADAEYCWLHGSDDAPTDDAVGAIAEMLDRNPGVSGISLGFFRRVGDDIDSAGADLNLLPERVGEARLKSPEDFARVCGLLTLPLSCSVVHRERWRTVVAAERAMIARTPIVPQVYITSRMVVRDPDWLWAERRCVLLREAQVFLEDPDQLGPDVGKLLRAISADLDRAWINAYGRGSKLRRISLERLWRYLWHPAALAPLKQNYGAGLRGDLEFLSIARHFWRSVEFRRRVLPLLLMPRSRMDLNDGGLDLKPETTLATVAGTAPSSMVAARGGWIAVEVRNEGSDRLAYGPEGHLALFARWLDEAGKEIPARIGHTPLVPALRRGASRAHDVYLTVPAEPGTYRVEVDLLSANRGWSATAGRPFIATIRADAS